MGWSWVTGLIYDFECDSLFVQGSTICLIVEGDQKQTFALDISVSLTYLLLTFVYRFGPWVSSLRLWRGVVLFLKIKDKSVQTSPWLYLVVGINLSKRIFAGVNLLFFKDLEAIGRLYIMPWHPACVFYAVVRPFHTHITVVIWEEYIIIGI